MRAVGGGNLRRLDLRHHPSAPKPAGRPPRRLPDAAVDGRHALDERRIGVPGGIGGIKPAGVSEDEQEIGVDEVGHLRGEGVVVPEHGVLDLVDGDDIILVHHRQHAPIEEREQGRARVEVAAPVGEVGTRQECLRHHDLLCLEVAVPRGQQAPLPDRRQRLPGANVAPCGVLAEALPSGRDRPGAHEDDAGTLRPEGRHLDHDAAERRVIDTLPARREQVGPHLDDDALVDERGGARLGARVEPRLAATAIGHDPSDAFETRYP